MFVNIGQYDPDNVPPVLGDIVADPASAVPPGGTVALSVTATDEDGDAVTFAWSATDGQLSSTSGSNVIWTAPATIATVTLTVTADDGNGGTDEKTMDLEMRAWMFANVDGETADSTYLLNPGTTEFAFTLEEVIPAGALVDSALLSSDFDPEDSLNLETFTASAVAPSGTENLFYDFANLAFINVDKFALADLVNEAADGTWKIKVVRTQAGVEGYADNCKLELYYRY